MLAYRSIPFHYKNRCGCVLMWMNQIWAIFIKAKSDCRYRQPARNIPGQIGFISPQAEFTPKNVESEQLRTELVYRFKVMVENSDNGLRQGMPVTLLIEKQAEDK